ncbi:hypothetical protein [Hoeflea sp. IMCC20628]|uniref:hypothetical protein n=1 Tax=Hoeflea sp. IMCC20628 TaxID=1620421 RepID=UPI000B15022A|nr:hypothetical protein [Hoeflea sp. IMCC20628]
MRTRFWTTEYPSLALLQMAMLVDLAKAVDVRKISIPSLFVYSPQDQVIQAELASKRAAAWGGPSETIEVTDSDDPNNHVIAGDALSPSTTDRLAKQTAAWIAKL